MCKGHSLVEVLDISVAHRMAAKELSVDHYIEAEAYPGSEKKMISQELLYLSFVLDSESVLGL